MRINRLLEITIILLNRGETTAGELARHFDVSQRTIYRDIDELSGAGVPVYATRGTGGGIAIIPEYTIGRALLSKDESESLTLALKTLETAHYPNAASALEKLGAVFGRDAKKDQDDFIEIQFEPWQVNLDEDGRFCTLKLAIKERRVIEFDYVNAKGEACRRAAEPMKLVYNGRCFYLSAFCLKNSAFRTFRVSRMKNIALTHERFVPRAKAPAINVMADGRPLTPLVLRFKKEALSRIYDFFDEKLLTHEADGSCTVRVSFPVDEWVYGFIMSFGSMCEVISPPSLRKTIKNRFFEAFRLYHRD